MQSTSIQPWQLIRLEIINELESRRPKNLLIENQEIDESLEDIDIDVRSIPDEFIQSSLVLPNGFLLNRTVHNNRNSLKDVLYTPYFNLDFFMTIDSHHVSLWRGPKKISSLATHFGDKKNGDKQTTVAGANHWVFIPEWKEFILSNMQMELKV